TDVALFFDYGMAASGKYTVFFPFFGGPDDRAALKFVVQLCANENVAATVLRVRKSVAQTTTQTETAVEEEQTKEHVEHNVSVSFQLSSLEHSQVY
ncbi:MAG TPA: hypothetical protein VGO47_12140, partial [Chlamydiales bacterium]|nr:hypothetical protein [Chlamydiales bacterium]